MTGKVKTRWVGGSYEAACGIPPPEPPPPPPPKPEKPEKPVPKIYTRGEVKPKLLKLIQETPGISTETLIAYTSEVAKPATVRRALHNLKSEKKVFSVFGSKPRTNSSGSTPIHFWYEEPPA